MALPRLQLFEFNDQAWAPEALRDSLALVDIRVLDHFVVGHGGATSFAERGLI